MVQQANILGGGGETSTLYTQSTRFLASVYDFVSVIKNTKQMTDRLSSNQKCQNITMNSRWRIGPITPY